MLYTGIDYHKRYSVVSTMDATGARVREARIDDNEPAAFARASTIGLNPATTLHPRCAPASSWATRQFGLFRRPRFGLRGLTRWIGLSRSCSI